MLTDSLTTEALRKKFKNNFNLCIFAINIGRNLIMGGTQSTLTQILKVVDDKATELNIADKAAEAKRSAK